MDKKDDSRLTFDIRIVTENCLLIGHYSSGVYVLSVPAGDWNGGRAIPDPVWYLPVFAVGDYLPLHGGNSASVGPGNWIFRKFLYDSQASEGVDKGCRSCLSGCERCLFVA